MPLHGQILEISLIGLLAMSIRLWRVGIKTLPDEGPYRPDHHPHSCPYHSFFRLPDPGDADYNLNLCRERTAASD